MVLRTGETLEALTTVLIATALLTPYFDTPSHLREFTETLAKRIRREVVKARAEDFGDDFIFSIFSARQGSNA